MREWNGEIYMIPEVIKKVDTQWLLVRKLEIQNARKNMPADESKDSSLKNEVMAKIKNAETDGVGKKELWSTDNRISFQNRTGGPCGSK